MEQAGQQLTQNQESDDAQDEALDRLNEARRAIQREQEQVEEVRLKKLKLRLKDQMELLVRQAQTVH
jgi:uncharacterized protein YdcH (DUF465 family)